MSASSHDAIPEFPGKLLRIDAPAPAAPDFTEDLADEITSDLGPAARRTAAVVAPVVDRADAEDEKPDHSALVTSGGVLRERYVLETQLGNGGTATVFRAVDLRRDAASADGHRVAIKLLRPELRDRPQNIARLQREFRQTRSIVHPNVVRFHDLDCDRGSWFIVMELLTGETLGPCLRRSAPQGLRKAEALRIALAVGEALTHAHANGITHGDVKPDNIYLTTSGEVRVLDFGVAPESTVGAAAVDAPAKPVVAAATRVYASPEVLSGDDPQPRDDVFSLACVIYEMLAGFHPYGRRGADIAQRAHLSPAPVAALDSGRQETLAAALDMSRAARPTMEEFVRAMRGETLPQVPPGPEISIALPGVAPAVVAPPMHVLPILAPPAAAPPVVALQRSAPKRGRLTWLNAIAAVLALVLGILIGRLNTDPPAQVAQVATSPVVGALSVAGPPEVSTPAELPTEAATRDGEAIRGNAGSGRSAAGARHFRLTDHDCEQSCRGRRHSAQASQSREARSRRDLARHRWQRQGGTRLPWTVDWR